MIYPWGGIEVPVRVEAEYPTFILATVLPHRSTKGFGISRPYKVTFHKHDIMIGDICLLYTSPSPRDSQLSRMPSSA